MLRDSARASLGAEVADQHLGPLPLGFAGVRSHHRPARAPGGRDPRRRPGPRAAAHPPRPRHRRRPRRPRGHGAGALDRGRRRDPARARGADAQARRRGRVRVPGARGDRRPRRRARQAAERGDRRGDLLRVRRPRGARRSRLVVPARAAGAGAPALRLDLGEPPPPGRARRGRACPAGAARARVGGRDRQQHRLPARAPGDHSADARVRAAVAARGARLRGRPGLRARRQPVGGRGRLWRLAAPQRGDRDADRRRGRQGRREGRARLDGAFLHRGPGVGPGRPGRGARAGEHHDQRPAGGRDLRDRLPGLPLARGPALRGRGPPGAAPPQPRPDHRAARGIRPAPRRGEPPAGPSPSTWRSARATWSSPTATGCSRPGATATSSEWSACGRSSCVWRARWTPSIFPAPCTTRSRPGPAAWPTTPSGLALRRTPS